MVIEIESMMEKMCEEGAVEAEHVALQFRSLAAAGGGEIATQPDRISRSWWAAVSDVTSLKGGDIKVGRRLWASRLCWLLEMHVVTLDCTRRRPLCHASVSQPVFCRRRRYLFAGRRPTRPSPHLRHGPSSSRARLHNARESYEYAHLRVLMRL